MIPSTTLKELARMLNLAPSTVSKALKGHPDISEITRKRVADFAKKVHYRPNELASSLRKKHSKLIAVIAPGLRHYFYAEVVSQILHQAFDEGYRVILFESEESYEREVAICYYLERSGVEGVLVAPAENSVRADHFRHLIDIGIPVVFFDRVIGQLDTDRVLDDDFQGAYLAVSHMIDGGCKKIAHISLPQHWIWGQKRQMGYIQALLDHHSSVDRNLIIEYKKLDEIDRITYELIQNHQVDGIFIATDEGAVRVLNVLNNLKCVIPGEVSVCGFGNSPVAEVSCQPLTTVARNGAEMGMIALKLLLERLNGEVARPTVTKLLKSSLIVRESTLPL